MKLHFTKAGNDVSISIINGGGESVFKYEDMIQILFNDRRIEPSEFTGEFSADEKNSIAILVREITDEFIEKPVANEVDGFMATSVF